MFAAPVGRDGDIAMTVALHTADWRVLSGQHLKLAKLLRAQRGHVVPYDDLILGMWGLGKDRAAAMQSLAVAVAAIREQLGRDAISTAPGRGYAWTA